MKFYKFIILALSIVFIGLPEPALSQEFQWVSDFNQKAFQDINVFKKKLAERFGKKQNQVDAIFKEVKTASDTYMAFKLSEMSGHSVDDVVDVYGKGKSKGWGALAKELGIKPGSKEFHALKEKDDLYHGKDSNSFDDKKKKEGKKGKGKPKKNKDK